jgi:N-acetyl-1-D-myo-inositol-2-amino-2-deoxy-alpha-D-glucopyranoside deacetylase
VPHRLLCVHPHPDDESIACGGLIARAVQAGHDVHVVTCTGGEEGENQSGIDLEGRAMADVRRDEMAAAIAALGGPAHAWLGYRDSGMAGEPSNEHPDAFHGADLDEAAGRLAAIIRAVRPEVVVSDDEQGTYGHPDHVKANRVTARAVELAADPDWPGDGAPWQVAKRYVHTLPRGRMFEAHRALLAAGLPSPFGEEELEGPEDLELGAADDEVTTVIDVSDVLDHKRAAMAAHRSQIGEDSFFLNVPDGLAVDLFSTEAFALRAGEPGTEDLPEHDVFAGLTA